MEPYIIESEGLGMRAWEEKDIPHFIRMNQDTRVMKHFPALMSAEQTREAAQRYNAHIQAHGFGFFATELKESGALVGMVGMMHIGFESHFTPGVEIGWRLLPEFWGQGHAPEAARACLRFAFEKLKLEHVYSFASRVNLNSEKVMQKIGMELIGSFVHPLLPKDSPLQDFILYEIKQEAWVS